jgi:hypothetical protein
MDNVSSKKVFISYLLTSIAIFAISATTNMLGLVGGTGNYISGTMSNELMVLIQLVVILIANGVMHSVFYYGGLKSSPLTKGLTLGFVLGMSYFLVSVFALNSYDINSDPLSLLMSALSSRLVEYSSGGALTAIISVSDIHRWGLLRAF